MCSCVSHCVSHGCTVTFCMGEIAVREGSWRVPASCCLGLPEGRAHCNSSLPPYCEDDPTAPLCRAGQSRIRKERRVVAGVSQRGSTSFRQGQQAGAGGV
jgi:hypothetical protein